MTLPPTPDDETERLAGVMESGVLDNEVAAGSNALLQLLSRELDIPAVAVTAIGRYFQHFKSSVGITVAFTPRESSFCSYTILQDTPLVVPDTTQDARFIDNPFVMGAPHIRFYAGTPLRTMGGHRFGAVCLLDVKPRALSPAGLKSLVRTGETIKELIHRQQQDRDIAKLRKAISDEMALGNKERVMLLRDQMQRRAAATYRT